jgi:DnaJ family protein C protein 7
MTESRDPPTGCAMFGIYSGMFRRRRSASMTSLHRINGTEAEAAPPPAQAQANPAHRKAAVPHDSSLVRRSSALPVPAAQNGAGARAAPTNANERGRPVAAKAANGLGGARTAADPASEYTGMAAELDKMILDHQRVKGTTQLVRATSGNMMLHRNLGNLNAGAGGASARSSLERGAKQANERKAPPNGYAFSGMGNIVREPNKPVPGGDLCRALSHRTDPEKLKEMGNEEYREGHYAEAVALYDQAIMMDARRPVYWSNKAAALAALGRLIEAVSDCKEAVRIDPSYERAHHRLGGLYLRYVVYL